jgi:hypothetical protein
VARARTVTRNGRVRLAVPTGRVGHFTYRLVAPVNRRQRRAGLRRSLSPAVRITVVRPQIAPATKQGFPLGDPSDFTYISSTRARWNPCSTITYRVNADHGPSTALADVRGAVARIEEATGLDLEYVGETDLVPRDNSADGYPRDTQLVIAWASREQSPMISDDYVAGVGGPRGWYGNVDQDGTPILTWSQGTVVINTAFNRLDPGFGTGATMGKLLMHEISHVVGLGHAATEPQVMYPTLQREYPSAWGAGDRVGLATLGAEEGCIVTPGGAPAAGGRRGAVSVVAPVVQN